MMQRHSVLVVLLVWLAASTVHAQADRVVAEQQRAAEEDVDEPRRPLTKAEEADLDAEIAGREKK